MENLIKKLQQDGYLKTPRIIEAFEKIKRRDFLVKGMEDDDELNIPLPINYGQTISQPLTVAFMLELLQPEAGDNILDVGSGSGWTTALLAELVGPGGRVCAIEKIPQLESFGADNLKKYDFKNIELFCGDGTKGLSEFAPFDRIQVAAAGRRIPTALLAQLEVGGRLVMPVGEYSQDLVVVDKVGKDEYKEKRYPGFAFVPLIED